MRVKIIALTLVIAGGIAAIYNNHQRSAEATAAVHSTQVAVDTLYRNSAHTLPAVNLTEKKITAAKTLMRKTKATQLSSTQKTQLQQANAELSAAVKMYSVTQATQTPVAPTTHYQQTAHSALNAYRQLQKAKPVFTQIYQQPVTDLGHASKAVDALNQLQSADEVSKEAIKSAKAQVETVTDGQDTAFAAVAAQVVSDAEQKVATSTATSPASPATPYDENTASEASSTSASSDHSSTSTSTTNSDSSSQAATATSASTSTTSTTTPESSSK